MTIVYKVARTGRTGKLYSCVAKQLAQIEYKIGKWAKAPRWLAREGYHVLVFTDRE